MFRNLGHKGSQSLAPETIKLDEWYAFTLNLPSVPKILLLAYDVYKEWIQSHLGVIDKIDYEFYIELSKYGRCHTHSCIKFLSYNSVIKFYEVLYTLEDVNYQFDTVGDFHVWKEYITKGTHLYGEYFEDHHRDYPIKYDNTINTCVGLLINGPSRKKVLRK